VANTSWVATADKLFCSLRKSCAAVPPHSTQENRNPKYNMRLLHVITGNGIFYFFVSTASAATIFSNLGAGDLPLGGGVSIQWEQSLDGKGNPQVSGQAIAMRFSVGGGDFRLDAVTLGLWQVRGVSNIRISITTDVGGQPSKSLLEIMALNPLSITSTSQALTFESTSHPLLKFGSDYWVVVEPSDLNPSDNSSNATYGWSFNPLGETSSHLRRSPQSSGTWGSWIAGSPSALEPSLRVDASAVPKHSANSLFVCLAVAPSLNRKRHP
jgi:hypothetical protein